MELEKSELKDMCKAYAKALDDLADILKRVEKKDCHDLIDLARKHVKNKNSRVLIAVALTKSPLTLVQGGTTGTGQWIH